MSTVNTLFPTKATDSLDMAISTSTQMVKCQLNWHSGNVRPLVPMLGNTWNTAWQAYRKLN